MSASDSPLPSSRRRGGQPGNTNALKHGLYARLFRASELARLQTVKPASIQEEIDMFRLSIRRLIEHSPELVGITEEMRYIVVLSHALRELTRMVKVQNLLPQDDPLQDAIHQALEEIAREWESNAAPSAAAQGALAPQEP